MTADQLPPAEPALPLDALARLNDIGARINRLTGGDRLGLAATLQLIVDSAAAMLPGSEGVLYGFDAANDRFDVASRVASFGAGDVAPDFERASPPDAPRPDGLGMRAVGRRRPVLSHDEPDLALHPYHLAAGARVVVALPLLVADQPLGALYVYRSEHRPPSRMEILLLDIFANQAATAIHHARRMSQVQGDLARKEGELDLLRHTGLLISSRANLDDTLETILQMALEVTGARYGIIRLVDRERRNLISRAIAGERLGRPAVEVLPLNATSVMGYVARSRQPLNLSDVRQPPWSDIYYPLDHEFEMRSELAVPLVGADGWMEGVLNLESPEVEAFSEEDSHLLQSLATQAVIAIQQVRLLDSLRDVARRLLGQTTDEALQHLACQASTLLNADAAGVWLLDGGQLALKVSFSTGGAAASWLDPASAGLAGLTGGGSAHALVERVLRAGAPVTRRRGARSGSSWTTGIGVPVVPAEGRPAGVFAAFSAERTTEPAHASQWDQKVLAALADYAALVLDNSARLRALKDAEEAGAIAESFAAMGDIAANLLHHLNNKVGAIPVRVEGIQDKRAALLASDPYLASNLIEIERSALDAMQTVRDRLKLLRPIERTPVSLATCIGAAIQAAALPNEISVQLAGLEGLPPVMAAREPLALIFQNLLENARDAMDGRGRILIAGSSQGREVLITVSDTGPGIPPELHERVFELEFSGRSRGDRARRPGLGFGLWWVKTLLARLGGGISAESDGRTGAVFRVRVPAQTESGPNG